MRRLDHNTVRTIAEIICDADGPYERRGWQLSDFLRHAGWVDPPEFDGSGRVRWLIDVLEERVEDPEAIDQVLCRLCDAREYPEEREAARTVLDVLNEVLAPDGLKVVYEAGRPKVAEVTPYVAGSGFVPPVELAVDLGALIRDQAVVRVLRSRLDEVTICRHHDAPVLAMIGLGSLLEGVLLAVFGERDSGGLARLTHGGQRTLPLAKLIDEAHQRGWLQRDAKAFSHALREYRNYVHPGLQWRLGDWPDVDTVKISWEVTMAALNDLGAAFLRDG